MGTFKTEKEKQATFLALYEPVHERFVRFCKAHAYGNYDADDLVNETVLAAYDNLEKLRNQKAFLHFLFGISSNILRNNARRNKFRGAFDDAKAERIVSTAPGGEQQVDVSVLYEALSQLSEKHREAVILFEISGFSIKEIMDIQGAGESAVKARLVRGRKKLAELMRDPVTVP